MVERPYEVFAGMEWSNIHWVYMPVFIISLCLFQTLDGQSIGFRKVAIWLKNIFIHKKLYCRLT